ncbi:methyltransferase family protein [Lacunimicrobium album]
MLILEREDLDSEDQDRYSARCVFDSTTKPSTPVGIPSVYRASRVRLFGSSPGPARQGRSAPERRRRLVTMLFVIAMVAVLMTTNSRWALNSIAGVFFFLSGMSLASLGALGRIWSNLYVAGRKTSELVVEGPYSCCRNPLYFFSAVGMFGIGLATATITIPAIMLLYFSLYYPMIIHLEEERLLERHGQTFLAYRRQTPAFWPRFARLNEPEMYAVFSIVFRRNLVDAFWFVALAAIVYTECQLALRFSHLNLVVLW